MIIIQSEKAKELKRKLVKAHEESSTKMIPLSTFDELVITQVNFMYEIDPGFRKILNLIVVKYMRKAIAEKGGK